MGGFHFVEVGRTIGRGDPREYLRSNLPGPISELASIAQLLAPRPALVTVRSRSYLSAPARDGDPGVRNPLSLDQHFEHARLSLSFARLPRRRREPPILLLLSFPAKAQS